ncbi:P-loop containing nucleoside triphosphate hydrolase protein [Pluteus cervinus]|uniref:P-loop containing nucleoside triphosphate hydrolase protein n=1 Tax=Pluteus cervinus TaxID=181527 RepID=A0ACD3ASK3_9AGAR|nr:P-loop containing nucleoside triphosphate hydrolase protein [Pluteus cervinus]
MPRATQPQGTMPSFSEIRVKVHEVFGVRPCLWQVKTIQAILEKKQDVVVVAGTGMGKTLTFLAPAVLRPKGFMQLIVAPLNMLGEQQVTSLGKAKLEGIFIGGDTATDENFLAIEEGRYSCVIITPEQLVREDGGFAKLCRKPDFVERIISVVFDEAHCSSTWSDFRPGYKKAKYLRHLLGDTPFVAVSATLPQDIMNEVYAALEIRKEGLVTIRTSTDRPNIRLHVRNIEYPLNSFRDLEFVLGKWQPGQPKPEEPPDRFVVFFDDINESIRAGHHIRSMLASFGPEYRDKVVWFNSDMTDEFKREAVERFQKGELWGLFASESFGLGMDIRDIKLVVQWRRISSLSVLWQRCGRGGRDRTSDATAVYLVESEYTDEERQRKEKEREEKEREEKEKAASKEKVLKEKVPKEKAPAKEKASKGKAPAKEKASKGKVENKKKRKRDETDENPEGSTDLPQTKRARTPEHITPADENSAVPMVLKPFVDLRLLSDTDLEARYAAAALEQKEPLGKRDASCIMDDFVNAQARGLGCRRRLLNLHFENSKAATDHTQCDPDTPEGCMRCRPAVVDHGARGEGKTQNGMEVDVVGDDQGASGVACHKCCDIGQPAGTDAFTAFAAPAGNDANREPPRSSLTHSRPMKPEAVQLFAEKLEDLIEAETVERYGSEAAAELGSSMIMPTDIFDRIIRCIRYHKAPRTVDELWRETRWDEVPACGAAVVTLINQHFPNAPKHENLERLRGAPDARGSDTMCDHVPFHHPTSRFLAIRRAVH